MSNPDQNVLKVLGVVFRHPSDQIGIPPPPGILLQRIPYPIECSSGILLSGLQERQWRRCLGWGSNWDRALRTARLIRWTRMEGRVWVNECYMGYNALFLFIFLFGCAIPGSTTEGRKLKDIYTVLLKV